MKLSKETQEQLNGYRSLIESENFPKIWETLKNPQLNEAFWRVGLDPFKGFTEIPEDYFDRTDLEDIKIPEYITKIGSSVFYGCSSLTNVTIPDSVTSIGEGAFEGCSSLTSVVIPDSVTTIGDYAFESCDSLKNIKYKGTVEEFKGIEFGYNWKYRALAKEIICSDGVYKF